MLDASVSMSKRVCSQYVSPLYLAAPRSSLASVLQLGRRLWQTLHLRGHLLLVLHLRRCLWLVLHLKWLVLHLPNHLLHLRVHPWLWVVWQGGAGRVKAQGMAGVLVCTVLY